MFKKILENNGCIITEYEFYEEALPKNFPRRNRIISGMSVGTVIIEAKKRSGSMITARYTLEEDKKLFCLPNDVNEKQSEGTNELIRRGGILIRNYYDIMQEYISIDNSKKNKIIQKNDIKKVPKKYENIYNQITENPINIEELYYKLDMKNIADLSRILSIMEIENYIEKIAGNNYIRKAK